MAEIWFVFMGRYSYKKVISYCSFLFDWSESSFFTFCLGIIIITYLPCVVHESCLFAYLYRFICTEDCRKIPCSQIVFFIFKNISLSSQWVIVQSNSCQIVIYKKNFVEEYVVLFFLKKRVLFMITI